MERDFGISGEEYSVDRGLEKIYWDRGWDPESLQISVRECYRLKVIRQRGAEGKSKESEYVLPLNRERFSKIYNNLEIFVMNSALS